MGTNYKLSEDYWLNNQVVDENYDQLRLLTVLARWNQMDGTHIKKRLNEAHVPFCELSNMVLEDFMQLGLLNDADHLLRAFKHLPNQAVGFEEICNIPASKLYNQRILHGAHKNLNELLKELLLSYLEMHEQPPRDLVVGEKYYASKFVIEAFTELQKATESLRNELNYFCQAASQNNLSPKKFRLRSSLLYSTLTLGITFGLFCIWKVSKV